MTPSSHQPDPFDRGCGERLRDARIQQGLGIEEVSSRLKMPARVIQALEDGDWSRLDAPVYIRGQLRSYARLLGVELEEAAIGGVPMPVEPTRLAPMTYTPMVRRMADKLMGRMVYIVITALIAVPVWMATRSHLDPSAGAIASLDVPDAPATASAQRPAAVAPNPRPLVASMASLPPRAEKPVPALSLRLNADSWVDIAAPDGSRVEQALMRAGEQRDFAAGTVGRVVLGNAGAVEVRHNGVVQDLSAYQRANVARFTVSSDGSLAPVAE